MKKSVVVIVCAVLAACGLSACSLISFDPSVSNASRGNDTGYYEDAVLQSDGLSFQTSNFLRSNLFDRQLNKEPGKLLRTLEALYKFDPRPRMLEIMADTCFFLAQRRTALEEALPFYLSAAIYSHRALFELRGQNGADDNSSRFDTSHCEQLLRYNQASAKIFDYILEKKLLYHDSFQLTTAIGGYVRFGKVVSELPFSLDKYSEFVPCSRFDVNHLPLINRSFGMGVPLVAVTHDIDPYESLHFYGNLTMPATAVMELDFSKNPGTPEAHFRLCNTLKNETINIRNEAVPLSLDFSTPVAAFSRYTDGYDENLLSVMLNPWSSDDITGLYMLEPYDPDKIPVVFVHGLMSSPNTWLRMINDLRANPVIRKNYQFWFYRYSSGNPVLVSARPLYEALQKAEKEFAVTPDSKDNFSRMVLVGHSMGGLISRVILQDDPHYFVEKFSGEEWETLSEKLTPEQMKLFQDACYSKLPFVSRLVMLAVPHRGSGMAKWSLARFGSWLINLHGNVLMRSQHIVGRVLASAPDIGDKWKLEVFTGIDNLDPDNVFIQLLADSPFASNIPKHSIIGNLEAENIPGGSDGVVEYSSSHVDGVKSELIVKSGHSVHREAPAIREVSRILMIHLRENGKVQSGKEENK